MLTCFLSGCQKSGTTWRWAVLIILMQYRTGFEPPSTLSLLYVLDLNLSCLFATPLHVPVVFFRCFQDAAGKYKNDVEARRSVWSYLRRFIWDNTGCHPVKVLVSFKKMPWKTAVFGLVLHSPGNDRLLKHDHHPCICSLDLLKGDLIWCDDM